MRITTSIIFTVVLILGACGGSGGLSNDAGAGSDTYVALDISSRSIVALGGTESRPSSSRIVFRRVPAGAATIGRPLSDYVVEDSDKPQANMRFAEVLMATAPLTQAQWFGLTNDEPWLDVITTSGMTAERIIGNALPAVGMTRDQVLAVCSARAPTGWRLELPSPALYEYAALGGSDKRYAWGDSEEDVLVLQHARVYPAEANPTNTTTWNASFRPLPVASLLPNVFGLYDMHGNVWQMTSATEGGHVVVCGGAWDQPIHQARASNRMTLPTSAGLPTVGVRLVLVRISQ